jgi:putative transposase
MAEFWNPTGHIDTDHPHQVQSTAWSNAICERLVGTLRRELLDRSLILGEAHLRAVLAEYQEHYNTARPHQGIGQRIPDSARHPPRVIAGDFRIPQIRRKPVLSGLINEYERAA